MVSPALASQRYPVSSAFTSPGIPHGTQSHLRPPANDPRSHSSPRARGICSQYSLPSLREPWYPVTSCAREPEVAALCRLRAAVPSHSRVYRPEVPSRGARKPKHLSILSRASEPKVAALYLTLVSDGTATASREASASTRSSRRSARAPSEPICLRGTGTLPRRHSLQRRRTASARWRCSDATTLCSSSGARSCLEVRDPRHSDQAVP